MTATRIHTACRIADQGARRISRSVLLLPLLLLAACGGGGGGGAETIPDTGGGGVVVPSPTTRAALVAATEASLTDHFRTAMRAIARSAGTAGGATNALATGQNANSAAALPATSTTTLQETGVDEADVVKTDASHLYSIDRSGGPPALVQRALPATGASLGASRQIPVTLADGSALGGFYLDGAAKRIAALGGPSWHFDIWSNWFAPGAWTGRSTDVAVTDIADPAAARQIYRLRLGAQLVGSRRIGSVLYLVLRNQPAYPAFDYAGTPVATAHNDALAAAYTAEQALPSVRIDDGSPQPLVSPGSCYLPDGHQGYGADVITLVALDLASATPRFKSRCVAGRTEAFYVSANALYLATTQTTYTSVGTTARYTGTVSTDIHKFSLNGTDMAYRGSGRVAGHLGWDQNRKSFRFGEHNGDLRVVTYTGDSAVMPLAIPTTGTTTAPAGSVSTTTSAGSDTAAAGATIASPATLHILRESSVQTLERIGHLPNSKRPEPLGKPGEQIYASRFVGTRGYIVTFRLTDPLYVLDLADPTDPKVAGALEVSGYSDYLFPLTENLLLGVGKDAVAAGAVGGMGGDGRGAWYQGVKVSLIDVTNPAAPREAGRHLVGRRGTEATVLRDHHGIALKPTATGFRVALPVNLNDSPSAYASGNPADFYNYTATQLQRYEVDTTARTLTAATPVVAPAAPPTGPGYFGSPDIGEDRAVVTADAVHWWRGGSWLSTLWP